MVELASIEGTGTEFAHDANHSCFCHAYRGLVDSAPTLKPRIEHVERSSEIARILAERCRMSPSREYVASRDVITAL